MLVAMCHVCYSYCPWYGNAIAKTMFLENPFCADPFCVLLNLGVGVLASRTEVPAMDRKFADSHQQLARSRSVDRIQFFQLPRAEASSPPRSHKGGRCTCDSQ